MTRWDSPDARAGALLLLSANPAPQAPAAARNGSQDAVEC